MTASFIEVQPDTKTILILFCVFYSCLMALYSHRLKAKKLFLPTKNATFKMLLEDVTVTELVFRKCIQKPTKSLLHAFSTWQQLILDPVCV